MAALDDQLDDFIPEVLREYGDRTAVALCGYLQPREPMRHLYGLVAEYPRRGGRMLRPSLCIATARVFGASLDDALHTAAALELLHNAFLVHDDVEDDSEERRGRPTLNAQHGVPVAVNVGDALTLLGLRALLDNRDVLGPWLSLQLIEETERMVRESIEGQAIELGWRRDNALHLREADYLHMVLKKTCWYTTIYPSRAGALIGSRRGLSAGRFVRFGFFLGAAFQIQDDLLNLRGDPQRYGKESNGDIWEGKRTVMLIDLLRACDDRERARLGEFLAEDRSARRRQDVDWVRQLLDTYGCLDHAARVAHSLAGAAQHEFDLIYGSLPESRDKRFVESLTAWVLRRS